MRTITFLFICLFSFGVFAENEKQTKDETTSLQISGKVVDHLTGENLVGVKIQLENTNIVAYTDLDGNYTIEVPGNIQSGAVNISFISYETSVVDIKSLQKTEEVKIIPVSR
jgi:hypothetical protein